MDWLVQRNCRFLLHETIGFYGELQQTWGLIYWVILGIPMGQCTIPNEPGWIELYNYFTTQQVLLVPSGFHGFREEFKQDIVVVLKNLCKQFRKNMNSSVKKPANSCLQTRQVWIFKKHGDLWQDIQDVHRSPFKTWWMVRRPHGSSLVANPAGTTSWPHVLSHEWGS